MSLRILRFDHGPLRPPGIVLSVFRCTVLLFHSHHMMRSFSGQAFRQQDARWAEFAELLRRVLFQTFHACRLSGSERPLRRRTSKSEPASHTWKTGIPVTGRRAACSPSACVSNCVCLPCQDRPRLYNYRLRVTSLVHSCPSPSTI